MIELKQDALVFSFPEIHKDAVLRVKFQRTLRIPDDDREYSLPPDSAAFRSSTSTTMPIASSTTG